MQILFENYSLDTDQRELRRGGELVAVEPQVFDLLVYLIENRAARKALGDGGKDQNVVRTFARKGVRFVAPVNVRKNEVKATRNNQEKVALEVPNKPSIAVLPFSNMKT